MNIINSELIKPNCLVMLSTISAPQFLSKLSPLINEKVSLTLPSGCFKRIDATASCQLLAMKILHCDKILLEVCRHKLPGYHYKRRTYARLRTFTHVYARLRVYVNPNERSTNCQLFRGCRTCNCSVYVGVFK